jgi:hypothetical protein
MVSVGTSIVPPEPHPPLADTPGTSSAPATAQATASYQDFAVPCPAPEAGARRGTRPLSIVLSLRCGHILAPWILAYDPEYSRFSPWTIQWLALFEGAATRGVEIIDFGYSQNEYEHRFANASYQVSGGGWASRLGSAARSFYRKARYRD